MNTNNVFVNGLIGLALMSSYGLAASTTDGAAVPAQMVLTVRPTHGSPPATLKANELMVLRGKTVLPILSLQRFAGDLANMQLFIYLDDSTRSASLGTHIQELKMFLNSLPATTEVAVGYMHNGTFGLAQAFTTDHQKAADSLRPPMSIPGENGSPYFALSDLVKHWPSKQPTDRRAVLLLTDGVDRYYETPNPDDPYVDAAVRDALKEGISVNSIYLRGAGLYREGGWVTTIAQSRLDEVSTQTGGHAYFQGFSDPVSITSFLSDLGDRLQNQYGVTVAAFKEKGVQTVKLRSESPGLKIEGPTRIFVH